MALQTFKEHYLREAADKTVTINFGRFNPPTIGHEKLLDTSMSKGTGDHRVYATQTQDKNKNPLDWKTKLGYAQAFFDIPISTDPSLNTIMSVMKHLENKGYEKG